MIIQGSFGDHLRTRFGDLYYVSSFTSLPAGRQPLITSIDWR